MVCPVVVVKAWDPVDEPLSLQECVQVSVLIDVETTANQPSGVISHEARYQGRNTPAWPAPRRSELHEDPLMIAPQEFFELTSVVEPGYNSAGHSIVLH